MGRAGPVEAGIVPVVAGRSRYVPAWAGFAGQGWSRPVGSWACAGPCLSLPEPLKERKKRCICTYTGTYIHAK